MVMENLKQLEKTQAKLEKKKKYLTTAVKALEVIFRI